MKEQRFWQVIPILALCASIVGCAQDSPMPADLILTNGQIVTVDSEFSIAEALAVRDGVLVAVGTEEAVEAYQGPDTRRVDLGGYTVTPGFIDGHPHLFAMNANVPLADASSVADILDVVSRESATREAGEWIVLDPPGEPPFHINMPELLAEGRYPTRQELDEAAPDNPVIIVSSQFHDDRMTSALNTRALELFGITRDSGPENVTVVRDGGGDPTGTVVGSALGNLNLRSVIPNEDYTLEERLEELKNDFAAYHAGGVTTIYEGHGMPESTIDLYSELWQRGEMTMRSYLVKTISANQSVDEIGTDLDQMSEFSGDGFGDDRFRVGGIALVFGDNVGFGQGFMREPYIGPHGERWNGLQLLPDEKIYGISKAAAERNFRVNVQASGSMAIDKVVAAFDQVDSEIPITDRRFVIIHCQFPNEQNMRDFARLGIIPTTVTNFLWGQGNNYVKYYGEVQADLAIPLKSWLSHDVPVVQSSDYGPDDGLFVLWQSIARLNGWTGDTLGPQESLTREEALRVYTINGARLTFGEDKIGSLETGKLADLVVLDRDILTVPVDEIRETNVIATLIGGEEVYGSLANIP